MAGDALPQPEVSEIAVSLHIGILLDDIVNQLTAEVPIHQILNAIAINLESCAPTGDEDALRMIAAIREAARTCEAIEE
jgi:hypothetical protein